MGFHVALIAGAWFALKEKRNLRDLFWIVLSVAGVILGLRFFPRYYFLLFAPGVLLGGYGLSRLRPRWVVALLLLIPLARFGPRYATLCADLIAGRSHQWSDLALDQDSREVARVLEQQKHGSLFVWGFRSEIFVLAPQFPPASRFLESQPLSGVLADRHLFDTHQVAPEFTRLQLEELLRSRPDYIVDALGPLNPELSIERFAPLADWFSPYERFASTKHSVLYRRAR
jgi:hypothetical protein